MGVSNTAPWSSWIQAQDANNLTTNYPLLLNPNGGSVGIGTETPRSIANFGSLGINGVSGAFTDYFLNGTRTGTTAVDSNGFTCEAVGSSTPFRVITNGTEKLSITSAGISQFAATGRVATFTGNGIEVNFSSGSNVFIGTQSGTEGKIGTVNNANMSLFANNDYSKRAELQTSGSFSITDGDLIVANGHGINFGSTTPDGTTPSSELLDDYEEGTWTPSATAYSGTMYVSSANYRKIGSLCFVQGYISFDSTTDSSAIIIGGLPFTGGGINNNYYVISSHTNGGLEELNLRAQGSTTSLTAVHLSSGDGDNKPTYSSLANKFIIFSGSYITT